MSILGLLSIPFAESRGGAGLNKIRYWLLLKMAEMPRLFAFGIGLLLALDTAQGSNKG